MQNVFSYSTSESWNFWTGSIAQHGGANSLFMAGVLWFWYGHIGFEPCEISSFDKLHGAYKMT